MLNLDGRALLRHTATAICASALAIACGGRESSSGEAAHATDAGEEGTSGPPADTFVNVAVGGGAACSEFNSLKEFLQIGTATAGHPATVQDGAQDRNASVSVTCTVHPRGTGFDVALSAIEKGPQGGSLTISSPQGQGTVTAMPSSGISATFVDGAGITFREEVGPSDMTGCTITYQYDPGGSVGGVAGDTPVPVSPPITAGRIWGHIKCPNAVSLAMPGLACDAEADFMFEQCQQ